MSKNLVVHKENYKASLKFDIAAGSVVFLVALPLCLGISIASGAPIISGLISGVIGGIVVGIFSRSQMSVSGPAAGLTAIVLVGIEQIGSFEGFLVATFIGGIIQITLGLLKVGRIAWFFPSSVIKGMLAAIGLILIMKEIPIALGIEQRSDLASFTKGIQTQSISAFSLFLLSFLIIKVWDTIPALKKLYWLPSALIAVAASILVNEFLFKTLLPTWALEPANLVQIPDLSNFSKLDELLYLPDWSVITEPATWNIAVSVGLIASLESLLTIEAVDKIDPYKRKTPLNRELLAQGLGNMIAGVIGGLPITSVIVRSSANINSGGRTKTSTIVHGILLLFCILLLTQVLNMIPMSSLAAILIVVGYKLTHPTVIKRMYKNGLDQFIPFAITIICILVFNLLVGVLIGILVGLVFIIVTDFHSPITVSKEGESYLIKFNKDISFLNKGILNEILERIDEGKKVIIDGTNAQFIDHDVLEIIMEFERESDIKNIEIEYRNLEKLSIRDFLFPAFDAKK